MHSSAANICVLTLVLLSLQQICHCRPHRSERGLVKDYYVPDSLVIPSEKFEKGEDGKYYLKKTAHRADSEVKYSSPENGNNLLESSEAETVPSDSDNAQTESSNTKPLQEEVIVISDISPTPPMVEEPKSVEETKSDLRMESVVEETGKKVESKNEKAPFITVDPKIEVAAKPDSKDEIPSKTDLPPLDLEEKVEEKITIGQVPDLYSRLVPVPGTFRVPVLIPIRQVSYGAVKVMPLPPADVSDRLPLPYEDDIIGEGAHESESEEVVQHITEEKKDGGYRLGNPLAAGVPLPPLSFGSFLKDIKEADKQNSEKQSKVVDVLGRKFLMQSNVMKYPTGDNGHLYFRFLSVKPLEEPKHILPPKEIVIEDTARKEMKEIEEEKKEVVATEVVKNEEKMIESEMKKEESVVESEMKKEKSLVESEMKEPEVLKVEETKIKMNVEQEVPKEVILRNMGESEIKMEGSEGKEIKYIESTVDEMKHHNVGHSFISAEELNPAEKTVTSLEKTESEVVEMEAESGSKEESVREEDEGESKKKSMEEEKSVSVEISEKKAEAVDALLKKEATVKETEISSKKDFFLVEKKKNRKFLEENEKVKPKKKSDKKKKCKCEEKDSDSDDDDE